MHIMAIDPGSAKSAWVIFDTDTEEILGKGITDNAEFKVPSDIDHLAIEMVACYGMAVGATTFETCVWIGRFSEQAACQNISFTYVYRKDVKLHLCGNFIAKDPHVRQALIDRYGDPGKKKTPGKLFGVATHMWAALSVAVTWSDNNVQK